MTKTTTFGITLFFLIFMVCGVASATASATNGTWNVEKVNDSGDFTTMALDSNGNTHIAYIDSSSPTGLKYVTKIGSQWTEPVIIDPNVRMGYCDIAIDPLNNPRISYYDSGAEHDHNLKYAYKDNGGWHTQTLTDTIDAGDYNSITIDTSGNAHISYTDNSGEAKVLMYIKQSGASWNSAEVVHSEIFPGDSTSVGTYTSIALDSTGNPRIAYYSSGYSQTCYAYKNATGWHHEFAHPQSIGLSDGHTSLALDTSGYPHISYAEWVDSTHDRLAYVYKDSTGWQTRQIVDESSAKVGFYTSIALDSSNRPHISYYDETNGDLKYAYWTGSEWKITTVDSTGDVGKFTSIALDAAGNPHVGYAGSVHYASFASDPLSTGQSSDPSNDSAVNAASKTTVNKNTIGMQSTGAPIAPLALAIISILGGLIVVRRK